MATLGDKNVRRLDIAVNDPLRVRGIQRVSDLNRQAEQNICLDRSARDAIFQGYAF